MPKIKKPRTAAALTAQSVRHEPLGQTIQNDEDRNKYASSRKSSSSSSSRRNMRVKDEEEGILLDEKTSERILKLSKEQRIEMEHEERRQNHQSKKKRNEQQQQQLKNNQTVMDSDDEEDADEEEEHNITILDDEQDLLVEENNDEGYVTMAEGTVGLSPEEEALVASMMGNKEGGEERKTLADLILEKIEEKEDANHNNNNMGQMEGDGALPPKVIEVYTDIGKILSRYTSGKLPKAFKVIPSLSNWEDVLYLTRPDLWTPQAMFAATRIFASNLNPKMAQRFYYLILLDGVRADIQANHKLNYHYYMALKKSVYKPAAFFKGILLPLCKENCTLREAAIVASVLQRVSIPVLHSAVAIHKLALLAEYNGAASIFIKTLLNKKYSLPAPVIGSLVQHYANFITDERTLPVLWHQSLLTFVQRYKNEVQDVARNKLRLVMKKHFHPKITPEIRRELFGAQAWKEERSMMMSSAASKASITTAGDGDSMMMM